MLKEIYKDYYKDVYGEDSPPAAINQLLEEYMRPQFA